MLICDFPQYYICIYFIYLYHIILKLYIYIYTYIHLHYIYIYLFCEKCTCCDTLVKPIHFLAGAKGWAKGDGEVSNAITNVAVHVRFKRVGPGQSQEHLLRRNLLFGPRHRNKIRRTLSSIFWRQSTAQTAQVPPIWSSNFCVPSPFCTEVASQKVSCECALTTQRSDQGLVSHFHGSGHALFDGVTARHHYTKPCSARLQRGSSSVQGSWRWRGRGHQGGYQSWWNTVLSWRCAGLSCCKSQQSVPPEWFWAQ